MLLSCSAWIPQECLWQYIIHKEKFTIVHRIPRGFREAMEAAEDALKKLPEQVGTCTTVLSLEPLFFPLQIAQVSPQILRILFFTISDFPVSDFDNFRLHFPISDLKIQFHFFKPYI